MRSVDECYRGNHVRVFRLDREAVIAELRARVERLQRERPEVIDVRLFGSLSRGQAVPGSDADLLLVLRESAEPFLSRASRYAAYFTGIGVGVDVFAYTEAEIQQMRRDGSQFAARALADGMVLTADRP